jgi:hypothetical protein
LCNVCMVISHHLCPLVNWYQICWLWFSEFTRTDCIW